MGAWGFLWLHRVPVVQRPRTPPFHGDDTGSNPVGDANPFNNFLPSEISDPIPVTLS